MRYPWIQIILVSAVFCLTASASQAEVGHAHHPHPDSPFVGQQDVRHAHCVLKGHSRNKPCPHILVRHRANSGQTVIANECGGTSLPSNSHRIGSQNNFFVSAMMFDDSIESNHKNFSSVISFYHRLAPHSLEPPPKSL